MARTGSRQLWTAKLKGLDVSAGAVTLKAAPQAVAVATRPAFTGCVLGIDPSLRGTGLAVLEFAAGRQPVLLHCATLQIPASKSMAFALGVIHREVAAALKTHEVRHVALEQTIYVQNFRTAQILGAARGAAISAVALAGFEAYEYAPRRVKQAVVGLGQASKEQMARTVASILGLGRALPYDEADAAGVALCHAFTWRE